MNSCILMAEILQAPQLRYTQDQTAIAEMFVQFPALKAEEKPATLKVVGWRNLAQEMQERYQQGDRVVIEGRLGMITVTLPDGAKEKRAELTASRIYSLGALSANFSTHVAERAPAQAPAQAPSNVVPLSSRAAAPAPKTTESAPHSTPAPKGPYTPQPEPSPRQNESFSSESDSSLDEIPF